jgi:hypothetical protein
LDLGRAGATPSRGEAKRARRPRRCAAGVVDLPRRESPIWGGGAPCAAGIASARRSRNAVRISVPGTGAAPT